MGVFDHVQAAPPDPIFGLMKIFEEDGREEKVNLTVGVYKTPDLQVPILKCVKRAEEEILKEEKSKEYLPMTGHPQFLDELGKLVFGSNIWKTSGARVAHVQAVGGTSALRMGGEFIVQEALGDTIHLPDPTWPNHQAIFMRAGLKTSTYPYFHAQQKTLDFERMVEYFSDLPPKSIVLLHGVCHNPTGVDPTIDQWKELSALFLQKKLTPFFDLAYQGFGEGIEEDAFPVRLFAQNGHEFFLAYSLSKNFSLYAERVGAFFVLCDTHKTQNHVKSKLAVCVRRNFSNPPLHGAAIVAKILSTAALKKLWEEELKGMRVRIEEMRKSLVIALTQKIPGLDFSFLHNRKGLFLFSGLSSSQAERLIKERGVYMTSDGRINVAGLTHKNVDFVVESIAHIL